MNALLSGWLQKIEQPAAAFTGRGELVLAFVAMGLGMLHAALNALYGKTPVPAPATSYLFLLALFSGLAYSSVFFLATSQGSRVIMDALQRRKEAWLAALPPLFVALFLGLAFAVDSTTLAAHGFKRYFTEYPGLPVFLFLPIAGAALWAGAYGGLRLSAAISRKQREPHLNIRHFGAVAVAVLPYLILQEFLPVLWCFATPVALMVLVYASRLGREHFFFSFLPRAPRDIAAVAALTGVGLLLFLASTFVLGTIRYTGDLWRTPPFTLFDSVFMWIFVVGISEEVIFRCGLMILIANWLAKKTRRPYLAAVIFTSCLFGLAHVFRGSTLFLLSFLASMLYGLMFVYGKSLFGPVLLHGILNILVLMNFAFIDFR